MEKTKKKFNVWGCKCNNQLGFIQKKFFWNSKNIVGNRQRSFRYSSFEASEELWRRCSENYEKHQFFFFYNKIYILYSGLGRRIKPLHFPVKISKEKCS